MNTRSRVRSESGYSEPELPVGTKSVLAPSLHRIYEDSPQSLSTVADRIPQGRRLEHSPPRAARETAPEASIGTSVMGPPAQPVSTLIRRESTSPIRRPTSPALSIHTNTSRRSADAKMKMAQYEAEKELAELEEKRLRIKERLIKARLAAEVTAIEAESEHKSSICNDRVRDWVDRSIEEQRPSAPKFREEPQEACPPVKEQRGENAKYQGIQQLADALEKMITSRPLPRQTAELPIFTGAVAEWLPYKAAMEDSTRLFKFSPTENLLRLRNSLRGEARETVLSQLFTASSPEVIMRTLEMKYGRPEFIIDRAMEELKKLPKLGSASTDLYEFAVKVQNIVYTIKSIDRRGYLQSPLLVRDVMDKLSPHLISKWAEYAANNEARIMEENEMIVLSEFLMAEADLMIRYTHTTRRGVPVPAKKEVVSKRVATRGVYTAEGITYEERRCFMCQSEGHYTPDCAKLKALDTNDRWKWAKDNRMCFKCLKRKHNRYTCKAKACGIHGCTYRHHALLHKEKATESAPTVCTLNECKTDDSALVMSVTSKKTSSVLLKTCKVKLCGPRGEIITHALLDEGSTVTLIDEALANQLTDGGSKQPLNIRGINEQKRIESKAVDIQVRGVREREAYTITARTVRGLQLHQQRIPHNLERYPYLRSIREKICTEEAKPRILIGADNWHLIISRQLRAGKKSEPAASWTKLGWVLHGSAPGRAIYQDQAAVLHICSSDAQLQRLVEHYFDMDSLGVSTKERVNKYEKRAIDIFEATAKRKDGHFEVGLPWKNDDPILPDSYESALRRLHTLEKKMTKEPAFKDAYKAQVTNLIQKGYATECDGSEMNSNRKWFLPHFAVTNHNKPGKVRMVFDAAAKVKGVCLNDFLLEGPDLLTSLTKILFGFREKRIAVNADIEEMFLRIKIRPEDQPAQMFLWRDTPTDPPRKMKMVSMIFGASSSPFLAHSVRNRNAIDFEQEFPEAASAIKERHYMDDYLDSFQSEEEAIKMVKEVMYIHERADFNLRGWNSNNKKVLASIPEEKRSKNVDVQLTHQKEKTLGLRWDPDSDTLTFNTDIKRVPDEVRLRLRAPTKRETLSAVMSVYDPLGLISQYTIVGKIILQQLWLKKVDWDQELPQEEADLFDGWIKRLPDVSALAIPRCYSMNLTPQALIELHIFVDASEQAYATVAYWRIVHKDFTETIQVMAKAKVAPLKILTIPRLELQAALVGARVGNTIVKEHTWKPKRVTYWSDSRTVLCWIRNEKKKYTPFVAHRLAEIAELTQAADWRWVPTTLNVADDATRFQSNNIDSHDRWFTGPPFLRAPEDQWPQESEDNEIEEASCYVNSDDNSYLDDSLPDIRRFSSYLKLIRTTALTQLFIEKLRAKENNKLLEVAHLKAAERRWLQRAQRDSFKEELIRLKQNQPLPRRSRLKKLDAVLHDDIIKARGRIGALNSTTHSNQPAILDGRHPFTRLLIENYHRRAGHANNERVVNELRQQYIILHLRPTVKRIARDCQYCRVYKAAPRTPPKGDLPKVRLEPGHRAFTYCGVDYFGPMIVTIGRRHEKRWCALFTCLTTRAIHLEVVHSLSTDSAIMALRRMAARRGWPRVIYSDNATNFKGADVELRNVYESWITALRDFGLQYNTDWRFIPPGAPHMGGAWERLVRSVKVALSTTLKEKAPKEEVLQTFITEAEYSVNARPLTHVSVDPDDKEALTPNHFLIGSSTGLPRTGPCTEADRSTWRRTQALADQFWQRWLQEYLPTLIPRGQASTVAPQLREGDLVMVVDSALPRNTWPRGVIERVHPGSDGIIRSADVRTRGGVFKRPTTKLVVLRMKEASTCLRRGENVTDDSVNGNVNGVNTQF